MNDFYQPTPPAAALMKEYTVTWVRPQQTTTYAWDDKDAADRARGLVVANPGLKLVSVLRDGVLPPLTHDRVLSAIMDRIRGSIGGKK